MTTESFARPRWTRPMNRCFATVIVPHLNQPDALAACLASLDAQECARPFEVIVVDNGSDVFPTDIVGRYPGMCLILEPRPGPGLARNCGVLAARGEVLCFIDADCRADPRWMQTALSILDAPSATVFGGDVQIYRSARHFTPIEAYESVFAYRFQMYIERQGYCGTGNMVVRRIDFHKVGPFGGVDVAEDVEWGARARLAGLTFRYEPGMIVYHPARGSLAELFAKWDRHIQHALNAERQRRWWRVRWLARALALLISPVLDVGKVLVSRRLTGLSARLKAIAVLIVLRAYRAWRMVRVLVSNRGVLWNRQFEVHTAKMER
jgi:GT2 family glycosyltransferase